jgi:DNA-directed RNA polymerase specialized sigma24 family protein
MLCILESTVGGLMEPRMLRSSTKADAFPKTPRTWIRDQLGRGKDGVAKANHHVMGVYAEPLKVYFRGSTFRTLGDADDIVNAFFADRLSRPDFLSKWESSERPMRYWLLVAFRYFLMEQLAKRRPPETTGILPGETQVHHGNSAADEFHREVARSIVRQAALNAEASCRGEGLSEHWDIWIRHQLHGRPLVDIADEIGVPAARVKVMARTAANRFRRTLREILTWPGATREMVDEEIHEMLTTLGKEQP